MKEKNYLKLINPLANQEFYELDGMVFMMMTWRVPMITEL